MKIRFQSSFSIAIALLSALATQYLWAQPIADTLVDVLPLSIGNEWTYSYNIQEVNWPSGTPYKDMIVAGNATYLISGQASFSDSTVWHFTRYRDLSYHQILWLQSFDTTFSIRDTSYFDLIESHSGQHQIYRNADPYLIHDDVFPFTQGFVDTTLIYRYRQVGLGDTITFLSWIQPSSSPYFRSTFTFKKAVGLIRNSYNSGTIDVTNSHEHFLLNSTITSIARQAGPLIAPSFYLYQNYPNPFNPSTTMSFWNATRQPVTLKVFDLLGREIATLVDGTMNAGYRSVQWNASNLTSGVYFCQLKAGPFVQTKKLLLMK